MKMNLTARRMWLKEGAWQPHLSLLGRFSTGALAGRRRFAVSGAFGSVSRRLLTLYHALSRFDAAQTPPRDVTAMGFVAIKHAGGNTHTYTHTYTAMCCCPCFDAPTHTTGRKFLAAHHT